jgi:hypothetical protein
VYENATIAQTNPMLVVRASLYAIVVLAVLTIGAGIAHAGHSVPEAAVPSQQSREAGKSATASSSIDGDSMSSKVARRNDSDDDDDDDDETDVAQVYEGLGLASWFDQIARVSLYDQPDRFICFEA